MFKQSFKYYKSRNPPPDMKNVLDVNQFDNISQANDFYPSIVRRKISFSKELCSNVPLGLKCPTTWEVFEIESCPGLVFVKNPFTPLGQRIFTIKCLKKYSRIPNKRNIDLLNVDDWWEVSQMDKELMRKLRWVTLGFHHNWNTKVYSEVDKGIFPEDLKFFTQYVAFALGYVNFMPEAAIVNYYHMDSTLSGHTDHSEQNLSAPLFSFSFGQTAIFLIGGHTIEEKPTPIFLRSGDIVVMSEEARLAYHGVPRIVKADVEPWNNSVNDDCGDNCWMFNDEIEISRNASLWQSFGDYLSHSRININVRQVMNYLD